MKRTLAIAAVFAACLSPGVAAAAKQVKSKGPVQVAAHLGYVMARIGPAAEKTGADTIVLYRIDPETSRLRSRDSKSMNPVVKPEDATALIGGARSYSFGIVPIAGGEAGVFVTSLTPGEWVIAGTQSTCMCMGSYHFTVRPGEVTDIGTIVTGVSSPSSQFPEFRGRAIAADLLEKAYTVPEAMFARPATEEDAVPASLAGVTRSRAALTLTRFDNAGWWMVNRMSGLPPMEHEGPEAANRVSDPRFLPGSSSNRWPDVADKDAGKSK